MKLNLIKYRKGIDMKKFKKNDKEFNERETVINKIAVFLLILIVYKLYYMIYTVYEIL